MNDLTFNFCAPTKIYFRPGGVSLIGKILKEDYHFKKVFLVYGGSSLKKSGAYDKIISSLKEFGIGFEEYGNISANPDVEDVDKIVTRMRKDPPDLILAAGGGSVIDCAKCAAHAFYYDGDPIDFSKKTVYPLHALPVATILTLSASGSEMSDSAVISDRRKGYKGGYNTTSNYPLFSLLDPELTCSVPLYQTGIGLVDMFSHSMERYFTPSNEIEPCDALALAVMREMVELTPRLFQNPEDYEARRAMMILGSLSHNGITSYGKKGKRFIVHQAEHRLSGKYPTFPHGQGIALLLVPYLEINQKLYAEKIKRMGREVFALPKSASARRSICALKDWLSSLPIYHTFEECPENILENDLKKAYEMLKVKRN